MDFRSHDLFEMVKVSQNRTVPFHVPWRDENEDVENIILFDVPTIFYRRLAIVICCSIFSFLFILFLGFYCVIGCCNNNNNQTKKNLSH